MSYVIHTQTQTHINDIIQTQNHVNDIIPYTLSLRKLTEMSLYHTLYSQTYVHEILSYILPAETYMLTLNNTEYSQNHVHDIIPYIIHTQTHVHDILSYIIHT